MNKKNTKEKQWILASGGGRWTSIGAVGYREGLKGKLQEHEVQGARCKWDARWDQVPFTEAEWESQCYGDGIMLTLLVPETNNYCTGKGSSVWVFSEHASLLLPSPLLPSTRSSSSLFLWPSLPCPALPCPTQQEKVPITIESVTIVLAQIENLALLSPKCQDSFGWTDVFIFLSF